MTNVINGVEYDKGIFLEDAMEDYFIKSYSTFLVEKEKVISQRLAELGINVDVEQEKKRRFKSFIIEKKGSEETIYYDDGSIDGLRVITFVTNLPKFDIFERNDVSFQTNCSYY